MRRFRKLFLVFGAAALALLVTIRHRGEDIQVATHQPLQAAINAQSTAYDLSQLPVFTKTLFHVRESYFDKNRVNPKRMLIGALDFIQRDVPEVLIDREPERDPRLVTVTVNGKSKEFSLEGVDAPWNLHSKLKEIFRFIQPNLQPVGPREEARRLVEIESAATNGMLYTLDPHSVLLDVESFKEMRMTTQGKFGGLGIVIGMDRKNRIIVRKPMPGTPAFRVGLKARDHIVRINNESTVNLTLTEAVERLRGEVNSSVDVYIERDGEKKNRKFTIVRDFIRPPSIDPPATVLTAPARNGRPAAKVGYFRMTQFTANTESDLADALKLFESEKVKGIIMDLRSNPGGLYDQAQKVADAFIDSGVLVSMVGVGGSQRRDEHATRGNDVRLPLAVLVNQNSASASEIVAGAMKHLDRGVVIGETTFGKGSVQMLFDVNAPVRVGSGNGSDDKLGLKLTTAQYLTAGDISIQGVGVSPDIELNRLYVRKTGDESLISLQPSQRRRQESDYEWHLDNPTDTQASKAQETVSYLYEPPPGSKAAEQAAASEDEEATDEEAEDEFDYSDKLVVDFPIEFARDLLAQARGVRRSEVLQASKGFFDTVRGEQDQRLTQALEKLGVNWSQGSAGADQGNVELTLAAASGTGKIEAGDKFKLRGTAKNTGKTPVHRVRAILRSDNPLFDENEMVFGKLEPGESRSYELTVKVPRSMLTRSDEIRADISAAGSINPEVNGMVLAITGKTRPLFAYSYQTIDDVEGNRDGRVQPGEKVRLLVKVKNVGAGAALEPRAALRNGAGQDGILISKGRFDHKNLGPGEVWPVSFVYEVGQEFTGKEYELELTVGDQVLGESVSDKIVVRLSADGRAPQAASGTATVARRTAQLREAAVEGALVVGEAPQGASFKVTGRLGNFTRVELEPERAAFIATADLQMGGGADGKFEPVWQVMPPILTASAPAAVNGESVQVTGKVEDDKVVRDVFIKVWNRDAKLPAKKVFYLRNQPDSPRSLSFKSNVPLWPGSNIIQVFARETNEVQAVQTLVVRRAATSVANRGAGRDRPAPHK